MIRKPTAAVLLAATSLALAGEASAQVLPGVQTPLPRTLERPIGELDRARGRVRRAAESVPETAAEGASEPGQATDLTGQAVDTAGQVAEDADNIAGQVVAGVADTADRALRLFELAASTDGWPVEARTVVALLNDEQLDSLDAAGLDIVAERRLPSLGATLVTFREPTTAPVEVTLGTVRGTWPGAIADYNHVYRQQQQSNDVNSATHDRSPATGNSAADEIPLRIGMIDSAVDASHFSLSGTTIIGRSFVDHEGREPLTHGTAVASLIKAATSGQAIVHSASVFFQTPNYAPGATTESLILALDWLAAESVDVINMSLAGPANDLLEQAVGVFVDAGPVIVAAVGNNGPSGDPMYPAAYDGVIGVTAVDRERRVYRYANRGDYVDFAALGVDVKVADTKGGGWRIESGTSMASPRLSAIVALMQKREKLGPADLVSRLSAGAEDLGAAGHDPVFGFGLIGRPPVLVSRQ